MIDGCSSLIAIDEVELCLKLSRSRGIELPHIASSTTIINKNDEGKERRLLMIGEELRGK